MLSYSINDINEENTMSHDVCDRIAIIENNQKYDRSRMGEICKKLEHLEAQQSEILKMLNSARWFIYGICVFVFLEQAGLLSAIKVFL